MLEAINRHLSSGSGGYTALDSAATIEHILPQTLSDLWKDEPGPEWERIHEDFVDTLGNLTLVTQDWNSSLSSAPFAVKRPKLASHALLLNNSYFASYIVAWDEEAIKKRAVLLTDKILEIWPSLVSTDVSQTQKSEAVSFYPECVDRVSQHMGITFLKQGSTTYATSDGRRHLTCSISKVYTRAKYPYYWFAFHPTQKAFLSEDEYAVVAFGCGSAEKIILFPLSTFVQLMLNMNTTTKDGKSYWHVVIDEIGGRYLRQSCHARSRGRRRGDRRAAGIVSLCSCFRLLKLRAGVPALVLASSHSNHIRPRWRQCRLESRSRRKNRDRSTPVSKCMVSARIKNFND